MAGYQRRERTTTRVEFVVPAVYDSGANWVEVMKAIHAAHAELHELDPERYPKGRDVGDNTITLHPGDEDIVVAYERDVTEWRALATPKDGA